MNKCFKLFTALVLSLFIFSSFSTSSHAYVCSSCWGGQMAEICNQDKIVLDAGEHSYGFLGRNKCYATYYKSRGGYVCPSCGAVEVWYLNGGYAYHLCYESHRSCSKGNYDVCPFRH